MYRDCSCHHRSIKSLISARRAKDFLAKMLFSGTTNGNIFKDWLRDMLCKELRPCSTIIWDNAYFHNNKDLEAIVHDYGTKFFFCRLTVRISTRSSRILPISRKSISTLRPTHPALTSSNLMEIISNDYKRKYTWDISAAFYENPVRGLYPCLYLRLGHCSAYLLQ